MFARSKSLARLIVRPAGLLLCAAVLALPAAAETATPATSAGSATSPAAVPSTSAAAVAPVPATATAPAPATVVAPVPAATAVAVAPAPVPAATTPIIAQPPAVAAAPVAPPPVAVQAVTQVAAADGVVEAARRALADKSVTGKDSAADDIAALAADYGTRSVPLWTRNGAYTDKAKAVIAELRKSADWGLEPSDFTVPDLASNASADAQGAAEVQFALAALKYARFARGGRLSPIALSNILDMKPPVEDPKVVLAALTASAEPEAYLRGLHPKHAGFERLRQALLKARGPQAAEEKIDPALLVKLPDGKSLKPGAEDDQIALLRQRLKVPAETPDTERRYDDALVEAVKAFQEDNGLKANGILSNRTRKALNQEGQPKTADPKTNVDRLLANLERWRWLPADLGPFYVMNNIPEFHSEIWKGSELKLRQKMIVGQPSWPTPVLAASMEFVIFHPSWGMPPGIMAKELQPRLKKAAGDGGFFDQLFGGNSGGAQVIEAYKLKVTQNGKEIDPNSVDWGTADVNKFGFTQPAGATNPLGLVKFRFPNSHNVYMHDTPQRTLFGQSFRALSHGCMRVGEPRRTAEVILEEDKGWSSDKIGGYWKSGGSVTLDRQVPVYLVYFTARVDDDGRVQTFGDIYGHDGRVMAALRGHAVRYVAPQAVDPSETGAEAAPVPKRRARKKV
jgi:L,D-transpeptidase YcbB